MFATNTPTDASPALIEAFNTQLMAAKIEALHVLGTLLRLDTCIDIRIRTQQRLAATAILQTKPLKLPKPPREPRLKPAQPERAPSPMPRSLKNLDSEALVVLAEETFAPDSGVSAMDKIRLARHLALEHARYQRAEMKAMRAQARASRRKPET